MDMGRRAAAEVVVEAGELAPYIVAPIGGALLAGFGYRALAGDGK